MTRDEAERSYLQSILHEGEAVLVSLRARRRRNLWTHLGRMVTALFSGGVVVMNVDFVCLALTDRRLLFIPERVAIPEAPLVDPVRLHDPESIPRGDIYGARFRLRSLPARYLWGSTLELRSSRGVERFSIDRDDVEKARDFVGVIGERNEGR
jgi:hypothetical protein